MSKNLILMVGLPYSGKTTKALEFGHPIVSPDAIRVAIHGERFLYAAELLVWPMAVLMVRAMFEAGHRNVVVDATNGTKKRRKFWYDAGDWGVTFIHMNTPAEVCINRADEAEDQDIIPIIERMAEEAEPVTTEEYR